MKFTLKRGLWRLSGAPRMALMALVIGCLGMVVQAGEPEAQANREKAELLERRAQKLKAEGDHDKAQAIMREAEELRAEARNLSRPGGDRSGDNPRRKELQRQHERALAEIKELRAAGKEEQALDLKRHIQELEEQLARFDPQERRQPRPDRERLARRPLDLEREGAAMDPQQRMRHIAVAIDNLHAAGMHEAADRLARQAQAVQQRDFGGRPGLEGRGPQALPRAEELQQLRAEIEELRQAVRELRARLEQSERR